MQSSPIVLCERGSLQPRTAGNESKMIHSICVTGVVALQCTANDSNVNLPTQGCRRLHRLQGFLLASEPSSSARPTVQQPAPTAGQALGYSALCCEWRFHHIYQGPSFGTALEKWKHHQQLDPVFSTFD